MAEELGLSMHEQDGQLICHPSVVRILPLKRAVRIDKKQTSCIRPSYLARLLSDNQKKPGQLKPAPFLEWLYQVYTDIVGDGGPEHRFQGFGRVVRLDMIYRMQNTPGQKCRI